MRNMKIGVLRLAVCGVLPALVWFGAVGTSLAQSTTQVAPLEIKASPDVYREIAGNDQYRMVEAVWKPGQRDAFHSHPKQMYYWVTACSLRAYLPDGTTRIIEVSAGQAGVQDPIPSHSVENLGTSECRGVLFEPREPTQ